MLYFGLLTIAVGLCIWLFAIYVNQKAQPLISAVRKDPALHKQAGYPSNDYFWAELIKMKYHFAIFLWQHKTTPSGLVFNEREYHDIRMLSNFLMLLELLKFGFILLLFLTHQLFNHLALS